jgi:phosphoserine aminotransferase
MNKPNARPHTPYFSSGPCTKRPGWSLDALADATLGRLHRSPAAAAKVAAVIDETRALLQIPDDYRIGVVAGSDTGAVEIALWSLLGQRGVDVLAWDSFGSGWAVDVLEQLKVPDARIINADFGQIADLSSVDFSHDVVFAWNGTSSGVRVPNADWIAADREGLTICDATSAVFAMRVDWSKIDVATWSWQKVLGGEAAHGMLVLSPRAVERLETYVPPWPLPKLFRLTKGGKLNEGIFRGSTINTPSLLCIEDVLDAMRWAKGIGGLEAQIERSEANLAAIARWVAQTEWIDFVVEDPAVRSCTSICLKLSDNCGLAGEARDAAPKRMADLLAEEGVAYDINAYHESPPGLRIWAGATVELADIEAMLPWLDWAFAEVGAVSQSA